VLTLDVSTSMESLDFAPHSEPVHKSRITGAKKVIGRFISQRREDRLGLVIFAAQAFTQCPLTLDYSVVQNILRAVKTARDANIKDGTAIGDAIAVSINRLRGSGAESRVIILITDGDDNASRLSPLQAALGAIQENVRIFTILVGKGGEVEVPVRDALGGIQYIQRKMRVDPELLRKIAQTAKGKFYRAEDEEALEKDLLDILDHMEKSRLVDPGKFMRDTEIFQLPLLGALLCLFFELAMTWSRFRRFP